MELQKDYTPDWARRAEHSEHRPNWQDKIPHLLWELGEVFFPIPPGRKGWRYPHHKQSKRFSADSEVLNGYFECGWSYGIACDNDLVVVDIDDRVLVDRITEGMPETAYQITGSKDGIHLFYYVEGLDNRQILESRICTVKYDDGAKEWITYHVGEIKCDPHGYAVGPESIHPSGNRYGPLRGDKIAEMSASDLLYHLNNFLKRTSGSSWSGSNKKRDVNLGDKPKHQFYDLDADDVLPWLSPNDRIAHPVHGSDTGMNFMKNGDRDTFTCWRCNCGMGDGCGINPQQLLSLMERGNQLGDHACEVVRRRWRSNERLHYYGWKRAVEENLVISTNIPYMIAKGYALINGVIDDGEELAGDKYYDIIQSLEWKVMSETLL